MVTRLGTLRMHQRLLWYSTAKCLLKDCAKKGIVFYDNYIDDDYLYKLYMLATNANVAFRHACLIFDKRGNVVASGYNYSPQYSGYSHTIHAEDAAIRDLKNKGLYEKAHKYTLFVVRIGGCTLIDEYGNPKSSSEKKQDEFVPHKMCVNFANSKPCSSCQSKIDKARFGSVMYSVAL
jgi:deoxycytidylate deaminase